MCGILVGLKLALKEEEFRSSLSLLSHRGPDEIKVLRTGNVLLGHTRLAINGLDNGGQPFVSPDKNVQVLVNGEIYNHKILRKELADGSYDLTTDSDCEIVLHLYQRFGLQAVDKLRGEFAGVIVDFKAGIIIAFRDRFGVKPLFYAMGSKGEVVISSEMKGIFATGVIPPEIDPCSIRDYFSFMMPTSIFKGIKSVPARSLVKFNMCSKQDEKPVILKYWFLNFPKTNHYDASTDLNETKEKLAALLEDAVSVRTQAEVPIGVYLSGGLDSTIVAALAKKHFKSPLKAFCIKFPDVSRFDESQVARRTANALGLEYYELAVRGRDIFENLEASLWHGEYPCSNFGGVGKYLLSRLAAQHVKVVLTGEGSDELFLGYHFFKREMNGYLRYSNDHAQRKYHTDSLSYFQKKASKAIRRSIGHVPLVELKRTFSTAYQNSIKFIFAKQHQQLLSDHTAIDSLVRQHEPIETEARRDLVQSQVFVINNLLHTYNLTVLGDRSEMAHSVEGRPIFLDHFLFDFAKTIPPHLNLSDDQNKCILREAMAKEIPEEVYSAEKWPLLAPNYPLIYGEWPEMDILLDRYMTCSAIRELGVFKPLVIKSFMLMLKLFRHSKGISLNLTTILTLVLSVQIIGLTFKRKFSASGD